MQPLRMHPCRIARACLAVLALALAAGCATRTAAPVVERKPPPAVPAKPPVAEVVPATPAPSGAPAGTPAGTYRVKRGDTLYSIALDQGQDPRDVARWSRLDNPNRIQVGQLLRVAPPETEAGTQGGVQVGAARGAGAVEARPLEGAPAASTPPTQAAAEGGSRTEPKALRLPYSAENLALLQKSESTQAAAARPAPAKPEPAAKPAAEPRPAAEPKPAATAEPRPAADPEAPEFIWPARGKLIGSFNDSTNKGVDIAGKPGDAVLAAAPGRVIYIGTGIRGYGKLIVIKHDANFNSVYAHNREILVKQDQTVARGQKIAELGDTDADTPKLHFEIRRSGKPVDPIKYLPAQ
jgi:lipoprotein NlpD